MGGSLLDQLNPQQREAARTIYGPVLVLAGAGTGKTRVITFRIAYMLQQGIPPEQILAMTFTNKAAREMKERIAAMVTPAVARQVTVGTFHSFCARVLRQDIAVLGFTPSFTIADDSDQQGILKQAAGELGLLSDNLPLGEVKWYIGDCKNRLLTPDQAIRTADTETEAAKAHIYRRYQQILENQNMLDFDDMLFLVYRLFHEHPDRLEKYRDRYRFLLVDEYQDTNMVQFKMIEMLAGDRCNLCVVGDDDQSIYGWRGAVVDNILGFPQYFHHKGVKEVRLEQNYRSTNKILTAANRVIAANTARFDKKLWSANGDGDNLAVVKTASAEDEAGFVANMILQEIATDSQRCYHDFAILYRSNHMSRQLEQSLRQAGVPYRLVGGQEFYHRKEIKDAAAYLKLLVNPREDQSFLRIIGVPARGIGDKAISELKRLQQTEHLPFCRLIGSDAFLGLVAGRGHASARAFSQTLEKHRRLFGEPGDLANKTIAYLREIGYLDGLVKIYRDREDAESRQENVYEFINSIAQFEKKCEQPPTLADYLENFALLDDNDRTAEEEENADAVTLSTVHAAKGLEFPVVFLVGMEFNIFPHERAVRDNSLDEELRLFYVAITRAKTRLFISHAGTRMRYGMEKIQRPSQFLKLLPEELVDKCRPEDLFQTMGKDDLNQKFADIFAMLGGQ
ncbi:MAG: UvrD-helicase domain-containing protein [Victivallales bacterium]|nr:UvrD-helicase domain-containing protein [Victivallales bacterium]